jgi:dTDP-4-dehydrorhamnose reductase
MTPFPATAVFGATGFVGTRLYGALSRGNPGTIGFARRPVAGLETCDFSGSDPRRLRLEERGISHAIIAVAVPQVAACESDPSGSRSINVDASVELAGYLAGQGVRVIALSSDYVFDGVAGDYDESAPVNPLNEYGRQKAELEQRLLREVGSDLLVIRLSKLFDTVRGSGTLLDEIASLLMAGRPVMAAGDQRFCPTHVGDAVSIIIRLLTMGTTGIIHLCGPEKTSRLAIARSVAAALHADAGLVRPITLHELGESFVRPRDTSMLCPRLSGMLQSRFRTLAECLGDLKASYAIAGRGAGKGLSDAG